jgi:hypothetical protein
MKLNWMFRDILREEAPTGDGDGSGGGTVQKTTVTINGKEVPIETVSSAYNLYQSLGDPETGKEIIHQLALRTGILKEGEAPTKSEEKKLENKFTKLMKTKLGKEYDKFSDLLGPVFDEAMESFRNELKDELSTTSDSTSWSAISEAFVESNEFTPEIETEMARLINRNGGRPAGLKGKAAKEYLQDMYDLAIKKLGLTHVPDNREADDDDSREVQPRRRRSKRSEIPEFREEARPKGPLTIDQIVEAASRGIRFKD